MDEEGFKRFLKKGERVPKNLPESVVDSNLAVARKFDEQLRSGGPDRSIEKASDRDFRAYLEALAEKEEISEELLLALLRYARFTGNKNVELAIVGLLDGVDVLSRLSETVRERLGEAKHEAVFQGVELPKLGSSSDDWHTITKKFMEQLEHCAGERVCREILLTGPHAGPPEWYEEERQAYLKSKNLDEFLTTRHEMAVATLKQHMEENTLFFNQEIDQSVIDFVSSNQEIMGGVREGDVIYETKIPYMAIEYLRERDDTMRRYYYCHCPWAREGVRTGVRISPNFCYCSAGYHKKPWEIIFGEPVMAEVVSSVLDGDDFCRFAIHIPRAGEEQKQGHD